MNRSSDSDQISNFRLCFKRCIRWCLVQRRKIKIMKKTCFAFFILLSSLAVSFAQTQFGVKGGLNFANLAVDLDEIDDTNLKLALTAGGFARMEMSNWLIIQPEVLYTFKGSKYEFGETTVRANLNYFDVPVAAVVPLFGSPVSIHAGPQLSFLTKARYKYKSSVFGNDMVVDDSRENYRNIDLGGFFGLGYNRDRLQFEARLVRGVINVEKDRTILDQFFTGKAAKNVGLQLTAGLIL